MPSSVATVLMSAEAETSSWTTAARFASAVGAPPAGGGAPCSRTGTRDGVAGGWSAMGREPSGPATTMSPTVHSRPPRAGVYPGGQPGRRLETVGPIPARAGRYAHRTLEQGPAMLPG